MSEPRFPRRLLPTAAPPSPPNLRRSKSRINWDEGTATTVEIRRLQVERVRVVRCLNLKPGSQPGRAKAFAPDAEAQTEIHPEQGLWRS